MHNLLNYLNLPKFIISIISCDLFNKENLIITFKRYFLSVWGFGVLGFCFILKK